MPVHVPLTDLELAWIAGFTDGEGCITVNLKTLKAKRGLEFHYTFSPYLSLTQTNKEILDWVRFKFRTGEVSLKPRENPKWKPCWQWIVQVDGIKGVLEKLLPYLRVKREHALIMLGFLEIKGKPGDKNVPEELFTRRKELAFHLSELNRRGL